MQEQTRSVTDAIIDQKVADKIAKIKREKSLKYLEKLAKHLQTISSLHFYGSTQEEVNQNKADDYFSTWFNDANKGDIHAMHSILDHFEPLEIITNMGHNYRSKFSSSSAEIILDFRPEHVIPNNAYELDGVELSIRPLTEDEKIVIIKPYLYSCLLRMAKELMLYFPLKNIDFRVNCPTLNMKNKSFDISESQLAVFMQMEKSDDFTSKFQDLILT